LGTIRITSEEIRVLNIFELLTGVAAKDCVVEPDAVGFLIDRRDMGGAIGKNGENINRVKDKIRKEIFLVQYTPEATKFIQNLFYPVFVKNVKISDGTNGKIAIVEVRRKDYKKAIGNNGRRIKIAKILAYRNLGISDILIRTTT